MPNKPIESTGNVSRQGVDLPTTGSVEPGMFNDHFELIDDTYNVRNLADAEAFYNEPVLVEVPKSTNPNDDPYIQLGVNGIIQPLLRGKAQWIKRRFLEVLVRSMPTTLETVEEIDPRTGYKTVRLNKYTGEKYPYRVLQDNNPEGRAWLNGLLEQQKLLPH